MYKVSQRCIMYHLLCISGLRSKWSEDEEDKVKILDDKNIADKQDFPYPNALDLKDS